MLGDGSTTQRTSPVQVSGLSGVSSITSGDYHSLALKSNGTAWAWGYNGNGQLGDGSTTQRTTPVQVSGLSGAVSIAAGAYHSIAMKSDGSVLAWGNNGYGQIGDGTTTNRSTTVFVFDMTAPVTTATPPGGVYNATQIVTLTSVDSSSVTIYYTVDGTTPTTTSPVYESPITISSATTLKFFGVDTSGNNEAVKTETYTFDFVPPSVTLNAITSPTKVTSQTISGTVEAGATVSVATNTAASDGSATVTGAVWSYTITGLVEGANVITVTARDTAGNTATVNGTITLDTTAPSVTLNAVTSPTNVATQTITGTVETGATVSVATNTAASDGAATVTGTSWSYTITGLVEGANGITVTATDGVGNTATATGSITYDVTAPLVSSKSPANGATSVSVSSVITATFNEVMRSSTFTTSTFTVNNGAGNITGSVSYSGTTATFTPSATLSYNKTYTATITTGVTDAAGNALASNVTWSFTTEVVPVFVGPTSYLSKADSPFSLTGLGVTFFLEDFEDHLFNTSGASASAGGVASVIWGSTLHDSVDADDGTIDGSGLLGDDFFYSNGATGIRFTFDARVLGSLPTAAGIVWTDGGGTTTFEAFDANGVSLGTTGPVSIADGSSNGTTAEDRFFGVINQSGISAIKISNTSGGIEVDHLQYGQLPSPAVSSTSPSSGATNVAVGSLITAVFSGAMDSSTITTTTFTVNDGASNITGTVSYSNKTATFQPAANLAVSTTYTAKITTGAKDLAGTAMAADYQWSFSTSFVTDTTPDPFTFTDQTGVALSTLVTSNIITVTGINAAAAISITGGEYSVNDGAFTSVNGSVSNGNTVKVRQTSSVSYNTITNTVLTIGGVSDTFSVTTIVDSTAPTVTLNPVTSPTRTSSQTITGTVEAGATVSVVTDTAASDGSATVTGTTWSYTITGLVEGANGITVTATDTARNTATVSGSIILDTTAPSLTLNTVTSPTNVATQTISGTVEAGATVSVATNTAASDGAATVNGTSWSYIITGLVSGVNGITVTATDAAGNTATVSGSITLDTTAPSVTLNTVTSPTKVTSQTITGTVDAGATVSVVTNTAASDGSATVSGTSWSYTITGLVEGANGITVTATDTAGNTATATGSITLDTTVPAVTLNAVISPTHVTSQTITGTVEAGATVSVATNTAASDGAATVSGASWSYTITGLIEGANGITVTATDTAGNTAIATGSITLDTAAPTVSLNSVTSPTKLTSQTISGTVEAGTTVSVATNTAASDSSATVSGTSWSYTITGLVEGANGITVTATDTAGNTATATGSITLDTVVPSVSLNSVTSPTNVTSQTITGSVEAGATVSVATNSAASDGAATVSGTSWSYTITGLVAGANGITITATDTAGNTATATGSITLDTTAPTVSLNAVTSPTKLTSQTITGTVETGATVNVATNTAASDGAATVTGATWSYTIAGLVDGVNSVTVTATDAAGNTATATGAITLDATSPTVVSKSQADGATGVYAGSVISATFSEAMNQSTITTSTFMVNNGTSNISGSVSYSGATATFTPTADLSSFTTYTVTITTGVTDVVGNALAANYTWSFTTSDPNIPSGSVTINSNAAYTVSTLATLNLAATDNVGVTGYYASENATTPLSGDAGWTAVASTASYSANVSFTLSSGDGLKTVYVWYKDEVGNVSGVTSDTITLDTTAPTVSSISPASGATGVSASGIITAAFNEAMNSSTITESTFTVNNGAGNISGTVSYSGTTATFTPVGSLSSYTTYTVTITTGVTNAAGIALAANYTWSFKTADTTPPTGSVTINDNASYTTSTSVTLNLTANDNAGVTGYYASESPTAPLSGDAGWTVLTSIANYSANVSFTLSGSNGAKTMYVWYKDAAGNVSGTAHDAVTLDTIAPTVASRTPAASATGVAANSVITANFSESMDSSTITSLTFTVSKGGSNIGGSVSYSGTKATFTPSADLSYATVYTVTVTTGVKDVAGNAIAFNVTWSFTTEAEPVVITGTAASVTLSSAILNGLVNAGGLATDVWFEYGTSTGAYGTRTAKQTISDASAAGMSSCVNGLEKWTTHYYRIAAQNSLGTSYGSETSFLPRTQTSAGYAHSLALLSNGGVSTWGGNNYGQLGDGTNNNRLLPEPISGFGDVIDVVGGRDHSLALKSDGTVWAWGENTDGELGNGTNTNSSVPVKVSNLSGVVAIAAGDSFSLAIKSNGTVWAWGNNANGQLGNGTDADSNVPVQVSGLSGAIAIAAGSNHGVALKSDGTVWAWGKNNDGQLGDVTLTDRWTPVRSGLLTGITAISAGYAHNLALKSDGGVWTWGNNDYGQLGDATVLRKSTPGRVSGPADVGFVATGGYYCFALKSDGTGWAWGDNRYGQLGDGTTTQRNSPVSVDFSGNSFAPLAGKVKRYAASNSILSAQCGFFHNLVVKSNGSVMAWGRNEFGQLGDGTTADRYGPVQVKNLNLSLDTTPPDVSLNTVTSPTSVTSQAITGTAEAGATVSVATNTAASDGSATVSGTTWSYTITGLVEGVNGITVTAKDTAGNEATATGSITLDTTAPSGVITINGNTLFTLTTAATLNLAGTDTVGVVGYYVSETSTAPSSGSAGWTSVTSKVSYQENVSFTLSSGDGVTTVYAWFKDAVGNVSAGASDEITLNEKPVVTTFLINGGAAQATSHTVTLNNVATGNPTQYMASESVYFADAAWQAYSVAPSFTLSTGDGAKTVYFKVKKAVGESEVKNDSITLKEMPVVATFQINGGAAVTTSRTVTLNNSAMGSPTGYMASEDSGFIGANWQDYAVTPSFTLSVGYGVKTVYFKVKNANGESAVLSDAITFNELPAVTSFQINNGAADTESRTVTLNHTATGLPTHYMASENNGFSGASWQAYNAAPSFTLSAGDGVKTVYFKVKNANGDSSAVSDSITLKELPVVTLFQINNGAADTGSRTVTLNHTATGSPTEYMASESASFTGAPWQAYTVTPSFMLSAGDGVKTVYFKVRKAGNESVPVSDGITLKELPVVTTFQINGGAVQTTSRSVTLNNTATGSPTHYMASENSNFSGASWQVYATAPSFTLSAGFGEKTVYFKVKNAGGESAPVSDGITFSRLPAVTAFQINNGAADTESRKVTLNNTATSSPTHYMASENPAFSGASWQVYAAAPSFTLSAGSGEKTVYFKVKNDVGESEAVSDGITFKEIPAVTAFQINGGSAQATSRTVTLNNSATGNPTEYMASESSSFADAAWQTYTDALSFTLREGDGKKTVYFKVKNSNGESVAVSDSIVLRELPTVVTFLINGGAVQTTSRTVTLNNAATRSPTEYMASESENFKGAAWQPYKDAPPFTLSGGYGEKTVYFKVKNSNGESLAVSDRITFNTLPVVTSFEINSGAADTVSRTVTLSNTASGGLTHYMASESPGFVGASWQVYTALPTFILSEGYGEKTVYFKVKNAYGESEAVSDGIIYNELPAVTAFLINNGATDASSRTVTLNNAATGSPTECMASESSDFSDGVWQTYTVAPSFTLSKGDGGKTVYFKVRNVHANSAVVSDGITLRELPAVTLFRINGGVAKTTSRTITLNNTATGSPTEYLASESASFTGAVWQAYSVAPAFTLSEGSGEKTVYFKVKNANGESAAVSDSILLRELPVVAAFQINSGASEARSRTVTLNNAATGSPTYYMASENANFAGARWRPYSEAPVFTLAGTYAPKTLSVADGVKTLYFKVMNGDGESAPVSDDIILQEYPVVTQFQIDSDAADTDSRVVTLNNTATGIPLYCMASESSDFTGATWQTYETGPSFTLSSGDGVKKVYFKVKNGNGESPLVSDEITLKESAAVSSFKINNGAAATNSRMVTLNNTFYLATYTPTHYMASESSGFTGADWQTYATAPSFELSAGYGVKKVYFKVKNDNGESVPVSDDIALKELPAVASFQINDGANETSSAVVTLNNTATVDPRYYMASESSGFTEASWLPYVTAPSFALSEGDGVKTVYFKVKNANGESDAVNDTVTLREVPVVTTFRINRGASEAASRAVELNNAATGRPDYYMASEDAGFAGASWQKYVIAPSFTLSAGDGKKTVYCKVKNANGESPAVSDDIVLKELPAVSSFQINNGIVETNSSTVKLNNTATLNPTHYMASEYESFAGAAWQTYSTAPSYTLSLKDGVKTVYFKVMNTNGESEPVIDDIMLKELPVVTALRINYGAEKTLGRTVQLSNTVTGNATHYKASESLSFAGASWQTYAFAPEFTLSEGDGTKTVYFKAKNANGESAVVSDDILLTEFPVVSTFTINNNDENTEIRKVTLRYTVSGSPTLYMVSESPKFERETWKRYVPNSLSFTLSAGAGIKTVYFKVSASGVESAMVSDNIMVLGLPAVTMHINNNEARTTSLKVTLNNTATGSPTHYKASESAGFENTAWLGYNDNTAIPFVLSTGDGVKTVYFKVKNISGESPVVSDDITLVEIPEVTTFRINNGAAETTSRTVTLNNTATGSATHYMASDSSTFSSAIWKAYAEAPTFPLSASQGEKTVYFKVKNTNGPSAVVSDTITLKNAQNATVADAGIDQLARRGNVITLDGSRSFSAEGNEPLTYQWSFVSRPAGIKSELSDAGAVNPTFTLGRHGNGELQLVVKDASGAVSEPDTVIISTQDTTPVAHAGSDQSIREAGTRVVLNGSQSYDPDGDALTYQWAFISRPAESATILEGSRTARPAFVADVPGEYTIRLTVTDGQSHHASDTVSVSFGNVRPVANAGKSLSVKVGETVTLSGDGTDANGDVLYYRWSLSSLPEGSRSKVADASAKVTSFTPDRAGAYVAQLVANDGELDSKPSAIQIQAFTDQTEAITALQGMAAGIAALDGSAFKNSDMQNMLLNKLNSVIANIEAGKQSDATNQLKNDIMPKMSSAGFQPAVFLPGSP